MKYTISIEGGFTGIPRHYQGEIELDRDVQEELLDALQMEVAPGGERIPDALRYSIELEQAGKTNRAVFTEQHLPAKLRVFVDRIREQDTAG